VCVGDLWQRESGRKFTLYPLLKLPHHSQRNPRAHRPTRVARTGNCTLHKINMEMDDDLFMG